MKKGIIGIVMLAIIISIGVFASTKLSANENVETKETSSKSESKDNSAKKVNQSEASLKKSEESNNKEEVPEDGYEIIISNKNITVEKGKEVSFDITFTNPDETSIREYIHCDDQSNIVLVKYSPLENSKIKVDVEGLKEGTTEIQISDYNYPLRKEFVKVNVVE